MGCIDGLATCAQQAAAVPRNTDFLIGRNDKYVDRAALRGDALFALYICCRIDADAEPGEAIADALPDVRGMLAYAAGEHQAVEARKGICHHGDFCGDTKCEEIDGFAGLGLVARQRGGELGYALVHASGAVFDKKMPGKSRALNIDTTPGRRGRPNDSIQACYGGRRFELAQ